MRLPSSFHEAAAETSRADQKRWGARLTLAGDMMVEELLGFGYSLDV